MNDAMRVLVLVLLCGLSACAAPVTAPPLEKRAVEAQSIGLPEAAREPVSGTDAGLAEKLRTLLDGAAADHRRFTEAERPADRLVQAAAGHPAGSEAWIAAQQSVSALETAREPLRRAIGAVDNLRTDPAAAGTGSRAAIDAAAARLSVLDGQEAQAVARLAAALN